jgi:hypothetical protein
LKAAKKEIVDYSALEREGIVSLISQARYRRFTASLAQIIRHRAAVPKSTPRKWYMKIGRNVPHPSRRLLVIAGHNQNIR